MFDFMTGTQARGWLFKSEEELAEIRAKAQALAKEGIRNGVEAPVPRSFASKLSKSNGGGEGSTNKNTTTTSAGSAGSGRPPPHPITAGVKRPRPDDTSVSTTSISPAPADLDAVTPADEAALLQYFGYMIQDSCGQRSESIKRGLHVQATALVFFQRFFLSNSMLDFDPKVVLMACMFLAGKTEYEYIRLSELKDVFGDKFGQQIIEFEGQSLLPGLAFHLKTFHPYNPYFGLVNGLESVNQVKKLGLTPDDVKRLVAMGQETIDLLLVTDVPLLHPPARIAYAVLVVCAGELTLSEPVEAYLSYCFEEEDEHAAILEEVARIRPAVEQERRNAPLSLEERKQSRKDVWKEALSRLKKSARWGGSKGEGKKRKKSKVGGGGGADSMDTGSVASAASAGSSQAGSGAEGK